MIRFHYFDWSADDMRSRSLRVGSGTGFIGCCHVYSDENVAELRAWAQKQGICAAWLQACKGRLLHLDLWGKQISLCGPGVDNRTFADALRAARRAGKPIPRSP